MFLKQLSIAAVDCLRCLLFVQLQKIMSFACRPTVWNNERSTFYKSWNTTLYYKNEAYVCAFVGMEVNKEKAFEVWHRRPDLDWPIPENNGVAMESPTMKMMAMIPDEKPMAMIPQEGRWTKKMEKQLKTAMKSPAMKIAMKSPTMKMKKTAMKAAMKMEKQPKAAMKKQAMTAKKKRKFRVSSFWVKGHFRAR